MAQHTVLASEDRTNRAVQDLYNPLVKKKKKKESTLRQTSVTVTQTRDFLNRKNQSSVGLKIGPPTLYQWSAGSGARSGAEHPSRFTRASLLRRVNSRLNRRTKRHRGGKNGPNNSKLAGFSHALLRRRGRTTRVDPRRARMLTRGLLRSQRSGSALSSPSAPRRRQRYPANAPV